MNLVTRLERIKKIGRFFTLFDDTSCHMDCPQSVLYNTNTNFFHFSGDGVWCSVLHNHFTHVSRSRDLADSGWVCCYSYRGNPLIITNYQDDDICNVETLFRLHFAVCFWTLFKSFPLSPMEDRHGRSHCSTLCKF